MKKTPDLRVCASCEYIFSAKSNRHGTECPICKFASYGARAVYGDKAYSYAKSQFPFMQREIIKAKQQIQQRIAEVEQDRRNYFMEQLNIQEKDPVKKSETAIPSSIMGLPTSDPFTRQMSAKQAVTDLHNYLVQQKAQKLMNDNKTRLLWGVDYATGSPSSSEEP